ncbi:MAG TPA: aspartate aminotransferase family protein [Caulobacteraceae bacterium]|jgi:glutamate-1-semialdehyde 2,1-aminomutase|nr:aspartate aminotransferase family protein [Caulobacteraceae bacterium]
MYPDNDSASAQLYDRAVKVLPGGNSRHTVFFPPYPLYAVRAEGATVWDADGVPRLDLINNYSALIHGHNPPEVVEAVRAQAQRLLSIAMPTEEEVILAELVCERLPGVDQVRFGNSGTEGVMYAIKAARAFTGRGKIAKIEGAYHGSDETATISVNPDPALWGDPDAPASVVPAGAAPSIANDVIVLPMNQVEWSRAILRRHADDLAGVILDPLVKNLGYEPASPEFVAMLREETTRAGALLIFDEVYSFRLGFNGAQGALGVNPDLTALGKVIGGGLPIGAVGGRADIMTPLFDPRGGRPKLSHGGTFNANPLTMAAGAAAMRLFDRAAFDRLSALGDRLRAGLREAIKVAGVPATVKGAESMTSLFHIEAETHTYRDVAAAMRANPAARGRAERFFHYLLDHGVMIGASGFFVLSTALTDADIDHVLEVSLQGLRDLDRAAA